MPLSVSVKENEDSTKSQLSEALPPPLMKSANVVNAGGTSPEHSNISAPGQVITGFTWSSTVMVCVHCPVFPQESAIEYILVMVRGQVPLSDSVTENVVATSPQLSEALPPPLMKPV